MTQKERILSYLRSHKRAGITSLEAVLLLGVLNLPGRLSEARASGIKIRQQAVDACNRYGETVRVNRYWLK
jgi:hypothetical protein